VSVTQHQPGQRPCVFLGVSAGIGLHSGVGRGSAVLQKLLRHRPQAGGCNERLPHAANPRRNRTPPACAHRMTRSTCSGSFLAGGGFTCGCLFLSAALLVLAGGRTRGSGHGLPRRYLTLRRREYGKRFCRGEESSREAAKNRSNDYPPQLGTESDHF
jgi:hypothetical protein